MRKRVMKITAGLAAMLLVILGLAGLDYLVNDDRKEDPVTRNVQPEQKDSYNQYGLPLDTELSEQPFYEDEVYIYYTDRLLKKFQYKELYMEDAAVIMQNLQSVIPEDVNQYFMPIPERIIWEEGYQEQKDSYHEFLEKAESILPDNVEFLDVLPILNEHSDEYLFFRTYNGWTARGAYYGSRMLCERMKIVPFELENYEVHMYNTFQGTDKQTVLLNQSQNTEIYHKLEGIPDDPLFYHLLPGSKNRAVRAKLVNNVEVTDKIQTISKSRTGESVFVGEEHQWVLAEGDAKSVEKEDKTAVVLCNANGQLIVPYLTGYYKQVYVINATNNEFSVDRFKLVFQEFDVSDFILVQNAEEFGDVSKSILLKKVHDMAE